MTTYRIAICDDNIADTNYVQNLLNHWAAECQVMLQTDHFPSAEGFLFRYAEDKSYDILLLDIEMGAMNGVTLARKIRQDNHKDAIHVKIGTIGAKNAGGFLKLIS